MADLWGDCFEPAMGVAPNEFSRTFCRVCRNLECERSAASGLSWVKRMATQVDRLIENPRFADPDDPRFRAIRETEFPSALREAMRLEISDRKGDWSVPSDLDATLLAAQMSARTAPPEPSPPPEPPPATPEVRVLRTVQVRGEQGDDYTVSLVKGQDGHDEWTCTCKAFEFGRARPCKHIQFAQTLAPDPVPNQVPISPKADRPPQKPTPAAGPRPARFQSETTPTPPASAPARPFYPTMGNIPMPQGGVMVDGTAPPPPAQRPTPAARPATPTTKPEVDPWAPPPAKPKDDVIPVGGRVVLGSGPKGPGGKK